MSLFFVVHRTSSVRSTLDSLCLRKVPSTIITSGPLATKPETKNNQERRLAFRIREDARIAPKRLLSYLSAALSRHGASPFLPALEESGNTHTPCLQPRQR